LPRRAAHERVSWGEPGCTIYIKGGSIADIVPGSVLEAAYGGAGNLEDVPDRVRDGAAEGAGLSQPPR